MWQRSLCDKDFSLWKRSLFQTKFYSLRHILIRNMNFLLWQWFLFVTDISFWDKGLSSETEIFTCDTDITKTKISHCDKDFSLWQRFRPVTEIPLWNKYLSLKQRFSFWDRDLSLWHRLLAVIEYPPCDKELPLCDSDFSLWQKSLVETKFYSLIQIFTCNRFLTVTVICLCDAEISF